MFKRGLGTVLGVTLIAAACGGDGGSTSTSPGAGSLTGATTTVVAADADAYCAALEDMFENQPAGTFSPGQIDSEFAAYAATIETAAQSAPADQAESLRELVDFVRDTALDPAAEGTMERAFGLIGAMLEIQSHAEPFLAAVGLYGVMAFSVTQRRQELGVRMALGAGPERIMRLVLKRGVVQLGIGMVLGIGLGYGMAGPLSAVTYGVETGDLSVYGAIVLTLSLAGLVASIVPARLATRADPVESMRP